MSEPFLGQISIFSFNFPPKGWAFCNGQLLAINQNQALFALLGTQYGGDGRTTFALPNLQGVVPLAMGQGTGLSNYVIGQRGGEQFHTLNMNEMGLHTHSAKYTNVADKESPVGSLWAPDPNGNVTFAATGNEQMAAGAIGPVGGGQAHLNFAPTLVLSFCIALQGIFPSQN